MDGWYRWQAADLILSLRVQPNAKRDEIVGPQDGRLRVRISAPAMEGRANAHLVRFLAKAFGVSRGSVKLLSGQRGRDKRLCVTAPRKRLAGMLDED
jgi:uncharacterized protein (TIGR00251 family)